MQDDTEHSDTENGNMEEENLAPASENGMPPPEAEPSEEEISPGSEEQIVSEQVEISDEEAVEQDGTEDAESAEDGATEEEESGLPIVSVVEAVLFAAREPLKPAHIARAVGKRIRQDAVKSAIDELNVHYLETGRAFEIAEISGKYQLMSRPEYVNHIIRIYPKRDLSEKERSSKLTPAALDTLSIIAYKQPVTRGEIEHIRGVGCGPVLRALIERGSVKVAGKRTDLVGQPLMYGTTDAFLTEFGLGSLEELPLRTEFLAMAEEFAPSPDSDRLAETGDAETPVAEEEVPEAPESDEADTEEPDTEDEESAEDADEEGETMTPIRMFSQNSPDDEEPPPAI